MSGPRFSPGDPEYDVYVTGRADERNLLVAGAEVRRAAQRQVEEAAAVGDLVIPSTGEVVYVAPRREAVEGRARVPLMYASPEDVEPPACRDGYVQVCPVDDYCRALVERGAKANTISLVVRAVLWADPMTGEVNKSVREISMVTGMSTGAVSTALAVAADLGVIDRGEGRNGAHGYLRLVNHDELQRLSLVTRAKRADDRVRRRRAKRRTVEFTGTLKVTEEEFEEGFD